MSTPDLSIHQLMVLRTLISSGWPPELLDKLLSRCGCSEEEWQQMVDLNYVALWQNTSGPRYGQTSRGETEYKRQSKGKWF